MISEKDMPNGDLSKYRLWQFESILGTLMKWIRNQNLKLDPDVFNTTLDWVDQLEEAGFPIKQHYRDYYDTLQKKEKYHFAGSTNEEKMAFLSPEVQSSSTLQNKVKASIYRNQTETVYENLMQRVLNSTLDILDTPLPAAKKPQTATMSPEELERYRAYSESQ